MTKLTSWARAWSDRVLLTPVLLGLAKPFQLLWAAIAFTGRQLWRWLLRPVWRWLLRPVWRWLLRPVWRWVLRPVLWRPLRWAGLQIWRWLLRPVWRWVLRPVLWLPLRWTGRQLWRWVLRPLWSLSRWAWAAALASPWIVARTFPNRGWLASSFVLALTAVVLFAPSAVNARTHDRLSQVTTSTSQTLGTIRPEISVNLAPFAGWGLEPFEDQRRELVLKQNGDELRIIREDHVSNAEDFLRKYANVKLGIHDRINLYPTSATVEDAHGKQVRVLQIEQTYRDSSPSRRNRTYQTVLYNYGTTVLLLMLSTGSFEQKASGTGQGADDPLRALRAGVRITP